MIGGLDPLVIAEFAVLPVLLGIWAAFWKLKAELQGAREDSRVELAKRQKMWDEEMIHIRNNFAELQGDHKDIKRMQEEGAQKIVELEKQHSEHERDQAVQLEILRDLKDGLLRNGK